MCTTTFSMKMDDPVLTTLTYLPGTLEEVDNKTESFFSSASEILNNLCGASTVAIDNKIEQAMDLVKSHLMFAVREEVEVLREQIKDLIEKNNQLEYENQILKSAATAETLAQLQQPKPPTHTQPPTSSS